MNACIVHSSPGRRAPVSTCALCSDLQISIGDIAVACRLAWIKEGHVEGISTRLVDPYPLLNVLYDRVNAEPKIMTYKASLAASK